MVKMDELMNLILHRGYVGVFINNTEGGAFETGKGLRQGIPFPQSFLTLL